MKYKISEGDNLQILIEFKLKDRLRYRLKDQLCHRLRIGLRIHLISPLRILFRNRLENRLGRYEV